MNRFIKYLNDENFIRQICNNDHEDQHKNNPEKQHFATMLKKILTELNIKEARLSAAEKEEILSRLLHDIDSSGSTNKRISGQSFRASHSFLTSITKYAAAVLILISAGALGYMLCHQEKDQYTKYFSQEKPIETSNSTQLILADGRVIDIDSKNTNIQYNQGKIIINRNDTLAMAEGGKEVTDCPSASALNHVIIPYGRTARLELPDGSIVHLNAGTSFSYPPVFCKSSRDVLLKGEAFFEVIRDEKKPFMVNANDQATIKVLGTHFNVSAYEDENSVKTTLVEGSVKVLSIISGKSMQISPGQQVGADKEGNLNLEKVNTEQFTSWINGVFLFDKESFSSILKRVERYYNIRFALDDESKGDIRISGKLNLKAEMEEIIEILQTTSSTSINNIKGGYYVVK
ncbi:MAG: FecR domain-containing protein [Bacteroidales bacterium]|nr:FecR domain-containing protein [Bacteroidales bacterium]MDD2424431.1 FecR domain-containing protein [Bacteroidales bacterium]MDD3990245.1 FecR domain-containing protein [Bacteroidales bacterium]